MSLSGKEIKVNYILLSKLGITQRTFDSLTEFACFKQGLPIPEKADPTHVEGPRNRKSNSNASLDVGIKFPNSTPTQGEKQAKRKRGPREQELEPYTIAWIETVYRARYHCKMCHNSFKEDLLKLGAHHIIPRSLGGRSTRSNLICLCHDCHNIAEDKQLSKHQILTGVGLP